MPRSKEYQYYLDLEAGRAVDIDPKDVEIPATKQEIGWRKQFQFKRMMQHARAGKATRVELKFLAGHEIYYPTTPKEYRKKHKS